MVETLEPQEKFPCFQVPNFEAFGVVMPRTMYVGID